MGAPRGRCVGGLPLACTDQEPPSILAGALGIGPVPGYGASGRPPEISHLSSSVEKLVDTSVIIGLKNATAGAVRDDRWPALNPTSAPDKHFLNRMCGEISRIPISTGIL